MQLWSEVTGTWYCASPGKARLLVPCCRASMQKLMVRAPASSAFCGVHVTSLMDAE